MSTTHTVVQGEHLSSIAHQYGFANYRTIWDDPQNAALKEKRRNPNVLLPGDQLFIPSREAKLVTAATGREHRFVVRRSKLMLRLTLEDLLLKPIAGAQCELTVEGVKFPLVSDAKGRIQQEIPVSARKGVLVIKDAANRINDQVLSISIGELDPVEHPSGQKARLNNLGYFAGTPDQDDELLFQSAVEEFQCDHMGPAAVDGKCGPKTQAQLLKVHGS